jgi:predicted RNA-binding protein YlxR (DUF448 family)
MWVVHRGSFVGRSEATKPKHIPQRSCIACRAVREKRDLVRVVRTPEGEVVIDPTGKRNGRGAYLCCAWDCFRTALKRKGFERAFKSSLSPEAVLGLEASFRALVPE